MRKLFGIFVFILFFALSNTPVFAKSTKVVVMSDVHIKVSQDKNGNYLMTPSIRNLKNAVKDINDSDFNYAVFTGDCVDVANKESIAMFSKIINALKKPYFVLIGNHDVAQVLGVDKKKFFSIVNRFSKNKTRKVPSLKVIDSNLVFIFMDGVNQFIPGNKGYFREKELIWLEKKLKRYSKRNVVLFQHYPLVEPFDYKSHKTVNADEYLTLLKRHKNVKAIVSGHYHGEGDIMQDDILHISVPTLLNGQYKELDIDYDVFGKDFVIRTKMHNAI